MRYSLIVLALTSGLALTACGQQKKAGEAVNPAPENATVSTANAEKYQNIEGVALDIKGAGASFPNPLYQKWSFNYKASVGGQVNYQSIGSSGGVKQIIAKTVDFGASDKPLKPEELDKNGLIQFPTVIGGVVPVVNIKGVEAGKLVLDGKTLAHIFLGKITNWNDEAIKALNPALTLPDAPITTVHRSDGSGTTFNFTHYLNEVSPDWASVGVSKSVSWPTDKTGTGVGGKGNDGVASMVAQAPNSIGYVEYAYAKTNNMSHTALINKAGKTVQPSAESFKSAGNVDWTKAKGFYKVITNSETPEAWPIFKLL